MSNIMPPGGDPTTQQQKQQGQETFLSPEERAQLHRLMGHPTDYPKELRSWIREVIAVDPPDIQISSFKGKGVPKYVDRQSSTAMTAVTNTNSETSMYTYSLKGKTLSPTGQMRIMFFFSAKTPDSSNAVTIRFKLGATTVISYAIGHDTDGSGDLDSNLRLGAFEVNIVNAGAYNSQLATLTLYGLRGTSGRKGEVGSASVDLSQDQDLTISADWDGADSNDTVNPQYVAVEVFNPVGK